MSEKKPTHHHAGDAEEGLKKGLRDLPKLKAPWFFEAELQRRLHEGSHRSPLRSFVVRPVPAYALSVFGVAVAGVLAYFMMVRTPEIEPFILEVPVEKNEFSPDQLPVDQHALPQKQEQGESNAMVVDPSGRGPSSGNVGSTIESKIAQDNSAASDSGIRSISEPQFELSTSQGTTPTMIGSPVYQSNALKPVGVISSAFDSSNWHRASRDSLDTLKTQADSVGKKPIKPSGK